MSFIAGGSAGTSNISSSGDVILSNPQNGHVLSYSSAVQKWQNSATGVSDQTATRIVVCVAGVWPARPSTTGNVIFVKANASWPDPQDAMDYDLLDEVQA